MIGFAIIATCCAVAYLIARMDVSADVDRDRRLHVHGYHCSDSCATGEDDA